nr:DUF2309 family protein [Cytophagales bacterium]
MAHRVSFDLEQTLLELGHYLPAQAPLKDFVHHNTLHAFQSLTFHKAVQKASENFGYTVYWNIDKYRELYHQNKINSDILDRVIGDHKPSQELSYWKNLLLDLPVEDFPQPKVGLLRSLWKKHYNINLDKEVHQNLFRIVSAYLDQGIAIWGFPSSAKSLLAGLHALEKNSYSSFLKTSRARTLFFNHRTTLEDLLSILVGKTDRFEQYLFDQQFAHPGWSGMVAVLERQPASLLDKRPVSLHDFIFLECILEIDALEKRKGNSWNSLADFIPDEFTHILGETANSELFETHRLWQEALEWSYYDQVIKGLQTPSGTVSESKKPSFQALFCIDDRCCSIRRYVERFSPDSQTYGTAGFFNLPFYFQPEHGKFMTKVCPAPVNPAHVIKESESKLRHQKDAHFSKHTKGIFGGWAISQTMGFWSALKLAKSIFSPAETPAMVSSFQHMDPHGKLSVISEDTDDKHQGLQIGFTLDEMTNSMEALLKSIGLIADFAPLVYIIGHGASSVNNTHYAGYDCGACSGRAGSVNARVAAQIGNNRAVRERLATRGILIPDGTQFVGGLHDTTRDEMEFYDLEVLADANQMRHQQHMRSFDTALAYNAKERSRRFQTVDSTQDAKKVHDQVKLRAMSLFEPRPEWNHATNALCIIGRRESNRHLFLDKRAFLNSYDHRIDPEGHFLLGILKAVAPVCGGINLEYYFSKVDNQRLGAGSKLPHNVIGLIGVANGMEGDLRTGLPQQMVDIHDPLRILITVDHYPEVVLKVIQADPQTYTWFANDWVKLVCIHPDDKQAYVFRTNGFESYEPLSQAIQAVSDLDALLASTSENLPVFLIA